MSVGGLPCPIHCDKSLSIPSLLLPFAEIFCATGVLRISKRVSSKLAVNASGKLTVPLLAEIAKYGVATVKPVYVIGRIATERLEQILLNLAGDSFLWQT